MHNLLVPLVHRPSPPPSSFLHEFPIFEVTWSRISTCTMFGKKGLGKPKPGGRSSRSNAEKPADRAKRLRCVACLLCHPQIQTPLNVKLPPATPLHSCSLTPYSPPSTAPNPNPPAWNASSPTKSAKHRGASKPPGGAPPPRAPSRRATGTSSTVVAATSASCWPSSRPPTRPSASPWPAWRLSRAACGGWWAATATTGSASSLPSPCRRSFLLPHPTMLPRLLLWWRRRPRTSSASPVWASSVCAPRTPPPLSRSTGCVTGARGSMWATVVVVSPQHGSRSPFVF